MIINHKCLVISSQIRKQAKKNKMRVSSKTIIRLSEYCLAMIVLAAEIAKKRKRKTIMEADIIFAVAPHIDYKLLEVSQSLFEEYIKIEKRKLTLLHTKSNGGRNDKRRN